MKGMKPLPARAHAQKKANIFGNHAFGVPIARPKYGLAAVLSSKAVKPFLRLL
jgi:hypothetical protein